MSRRKCLKAFLRGNHIFCFNCFLHSNWGVNAIFEIPNLSKSEPKQESTIWSIELQNGGSTSRIHQTKGGFVSKFHQLDWGLPLEFIIIQPPKGGPPLGFINIQIQNGGLPLEFINMHQSKNVGPPLRTMSMDLAVPILFKSNLIRVKNSTSAII